MSQITVTPTSGSVGVSVGSTSRTAVTVGNVGPQGPPGPQGPQGIPGVTPLYWEGTRAEFDAIPPEEIDPSTLYLIYA